MISLSQALSIVLLTICVADAMQADVPWAMPREISSFQFLLDRSPFSLPTAEESSPLADRFSLTGAAALDGETLVFILDKTTQTRHMLSKIPNKQNMGLVEYLADPDPRRMRATIRVDGQVATIAYVESSTQHQEIQSSQKPAGTPQQLPAIVSVPGAPTTSGSPALQQQNSIPANRRVIRRKIISDQLSTGS